jgi:protein-S-isoprenylcysteine O-methyltransferase Ste14
MNGMLICEFLWVVFLLVWLIWAIRTKPIERREGVSSRLSYVILTVVAFYAMFSGNVPRAWLRVRMFPGNPAAEILGVLLTAAGIAFAIWARAYLGGNWSSSVTVKVGHQLVRSGPYRWVRHPIYSGMILAMIGTAIGRGQVRGVVAVVLLYAGFRIKSLIEERVMLNTFGEEYEAYSRSTGAIIPGMRYL